MASNGTSSAHEAVYAVAGLPVILPSGVHRGTTIGALVVSAWCSVLAFGLVVAAAYFYFVAFSNDRLVFKLLVTTCLALCILDTVANCVWSYDWLVRLWGSVPGAGNVPHLYYVNTICCGVTTLIVQSFFAWRVWRVSGHQRLLPALIAVCGIVQCGFVIALVAGWGKEVPVTAVHEHMAAVYGWGAVGVVGDLLITSSIVYFVRKRSAREDVEWSLNRAMSCTIQANVLSLASHVMTLVSFHLPGLFFVLNNVVLSKIYVFSLIISLNVRQSSRALFDKSLPTMSGTSGNNVPLSPIVWNRSAAGTGGLMAHAPVVRITETVDVTTDHEWDTRRTKFQLDDES